MKLTKKQNTGSGSLPEYGAIFMSNSTTKKECLRRKIFGLSSTKCNFVKHIKAGMILFLFEYESRELYGVFEACSDGAMNIVPDAFSSSGLHCPAQVKFKPIWICEPLPEREFRDAIKDNYFSAKKFNFGLSEVQVSRLLQLFSLRKLGEPERRLAKSRNANPTVHSLDEVSEVDERVNNVYVWGNSNVDIEPKSATTSEDLPLDLDKVESDDSKFAMCGWERNKYHLNSVLQPAISSEYSKYHLGVVRKVPVDEVPIERYKVSGFEPTVRTEYPSLPQSKLSWSFGSTKPRLVTNPLNPDRMKPPSPFHHQMDSQLLANLSSKASYRDAGVMSSHPYDSVVPGLNYQYPSSNEVNFRSTVEGCLPPADYSENVISSSIRQPFSLYPQPKGMTENLDKNSTLGDHVFSGHIPNENSYHGTVTGLSQAAYSENLDPESFKIQSYTGKSSLKFSLADVPSMGTAIDPRENPFSYCPLGSNVYPSSMDDYGYQIEPKAHLGHEEAWRKKDEASMVNMTSSYVDPFTLQGCVSSIDPQSLEHYEYDYDLEPYQSSDTLYSVPPKNRVSVFSRLALASDADRPEHNADILNEVNGSSKSVDGIMETLHMKHNQWVKLKKPKPGSTQDDVGKLGNKRKATASCKAKTDCSKISTKGMKVDCFPAAAEGIKVGCCLAGAEAMIVNCSQAGAGDRKVDRSLAGAEKVDCFVAGAEDMKVGCSQENATQPSDAKSFLNFKRRSDMHKLHNDGNTASHNATSVREGALGGQQKKRKLIRPNFSRNDSSGDKGAKNLLFVLQESAQEIPVVKDNSTSVCEGALRGQQKKKKLVRPNFSKSDSSDDKGIKNCDLILQESAREIPVIKDKAGGCEASISDQNNENKILSQSGKQLQLRCLSDHGDGDFNSERKDTRVGSCSRSERIGDKVVKESANYEIDVRNATISETCEEKNPDDDLIVNGPSLVHHKTSHFLVQETLLHLPEEKVETGYEFAGDECERNNKADLLSSAQSVDETCPKSSHASKKSIHISSNQFSELQSAGKEHATTHVDVPKENVQQILRDPEQIHFRILLTSPSSHLKDLGEILMPSMVQRFVNAAVNDDSDENVRNFFLSGSSW